jgi:hypothetical protein
MHTPSQSLMAAQAPHEGDADALGAAVLMSDLILAQLWGLLDGDAKRALRLVCRGVRVQVDTGAVQELDAGDAEASELGKALARFPGVDSLKASCHSDGLEAAVISAAPLHRLRTLELRYKVRAMRPGDLHAKSPRAVGHAPPTPPPMHLHLGLSPDHAPPDLPAHSSKHTSTCTCIHAPWAMHRQSALAPAHHDTRTWCACRTFQS